MKTRILNSKTMLFLFFAFTVCVSQEKAIYFSYDSPVNMIFTAYNGGHPAPTGPALPNLLMRSVF